jgi:hypothetical protein
VRKLTDGTEARVSVCLDLCLTSIGRRVRPLLPVGGSGRMQVWAVSTDVSGREETKGRSEKGPVEDCEKFRILGCSEMKNTKTSCTDSFSRFVC